MTFYFAFGSNLSSARLHKRIPGAIAVGAARLDGWCFRCDKAGNDGTAKANIHRDVDAHVWGVVYALSPDDLVVLDRYEGGYERVDVAVLRGHESVACATYASTLLGANVRPAAWYKRHIVSGAREHGLPADWIAMLEALPVDRPASP